MEGDFLVYPANRGYLFQMVVTSAVTWHGKHEIILCKPFVAFDQFFGNFHQGTLLDTLVLVRRVMIHSSPSKSMRWILSKVSVFISM